MNQDERKRKFNDAIVDMLFPPPPSPPEEESKPGQASFIGFDSDANPDTSDGYVHASTSSEEERESESRKLTRAQRKKIRKKKLKEEAVRRGELIGPLLPAGERFGSEQDANHPPAVRSNAPESQENCGTEETGPQTSKKVNQRRKAKRMAKVKQNSCNAENLNQHCASDPSVDLNEDH